MNIYPSTFPTPTIQGYAMQVDMGIIRTPFDTGRYRQRRTYKTIPHTFQFRFVVKNTDLDDWLQWVNNYAYEWFQINIYSFLTPQTNETCSPHAIRFISNISIAPLTTKYLEIGVTAEMVDPLNNIITPLTQQWIIGGTPIDPSTEWIIGGTPDAPSPDFTNAGTPQSPAAVI